MLSAHSQSPVVAQTAMVEYEYRMREPGGPVRHILTRRQGVGDHDGSVTEIWHCLVEDTIEEEERFTDFCFAQSNSLRLFSSLSVLLLKGSGDIFSASPVVFDGTVIASSDIDEGCEYLQSQLDRCIDRNSAKWRQCKAASQFFVDVFGCSENRSNYRTARILYQAEKTAATWPLRLQGPLLFHSEAEAGHLLLL